MAALMSGLNNYENKKDCVKNADFKNLETFIKQYLNIPDKNQRLKIAEEFRNRHLELHKFLKENSELVNAETEINRIISNAVQGMTEDKGEGESVTIVDDIPKTD